MKVSAKAEYACLAMLELVRRREQPEPVRLTDICERDQIPERFLVQILLVLKAAGYVQSVRGAGGGYRLSVAPDQLSLWDVIRLVDGPQVLEASDDAAERGAGWQLLQNVWRDVSQREEMHLRGISFQRLAEQAAEQNANMFYI